MPGAHQAAMAPQLRSVSDDTLDVLLDRLRVLKVVVDSAHVRIGGFNEELAHLRTEIAREQHERIQSLEAIRLELTAWMDSTSESAVSAMRSGVEADLDRLRNEMGSARLELDAEVSILAGDLRATDSTVASISAAANDGMAALNSRMMDETSFRVSGDRFNLQAAGMAAGLLLIGVVFLWWMGRRKAAALDGSVSRIQPAIMGTLEQLRAEITAHTQERSIEALDKLLGVINPMAESLGEIQRLADAASAEPDHELPVAVCNVVSRIERNLNAMGSAVRGHKHLVRCVRDVKASLRHHNYEMPDLVGMQYDTRMENLKPEFSLDEQLEPGDQIITRINRPLVLYSGRPVQGASVTVSIGP